MILSYVKITVVSCIFFLLIIACNNTKTFTMDLSHFFDIDKNVTYLYKIIDTHEVNGKKELLMPERYMEKHLVAAENDCINIQSYILFEPKDIERMDARIKSELKDNKLRTIDEKYCAKENSIIVNGEVMVDLQNSWVMQVEPQSSDGVKQDEGTISCRVVGISEKLLLDKKRKIIHTQCNGKSIEKADWFFAENIGLYRYVMETEYPEFHSKSKNEMILIKEVNE